MNWQTQFNSGEVVYRDDSGMVICGNALDVLKGFPDNSISCVVTSPPYWGLRDYGIDGQIGLEKTPEEYVNNLVNVFREVKRVLKKEGTLWLNLGDSYATQHAVGTKDDDTGWKHGKLSKGYQARTGCPMGLKPKDLCGIPWRVAFALQADGWWLRQDIIWAKPNPMPESVTDRCTKSHEYIFLLSKSAKYFYDHEAIKEDSVDEESYSGRRFRGRVAIYGSGAIPNADGNTIHSGNNEILGKTYEKRNRRSVWNIAVDTGNGVHFAVYPEELVTPCILAGCPKDGIVLDCFGGSCTTGKVAAQLGRKYVCIELNPKYITDVASTRLTEVSTGVPVKEQRAGQKALFEVK